MGPGYSESVSGGMSEGNCRLCISITKWMPVVFILTVISWSYYAFAIQVCIFTMQETWLKIVSLAIYHVVTFLFLWSYWKTIFTASSRVPRKFKIPPSDVERMDAATQETEIREILERIVRQNELPVQTRTNLTQLRYCEKCHIVKPDRTHHCSVCGYCILKMDHHCPWVNNCVCFDNYKFFILFLGYAFLYCFVIFVFSLRYFVQFWQEGNSIGNGQFHVLFVFFVAAMFALSLLSLLSYHLYLVTKNRSTLESFRAPIFSHGPDKRGFNLGAYNNFVEVFGDDKKKWFIPVFSSLGDGISFPTRHGMTAGNGPYNSLDTTESSAASGSPDLVQVKVEARTEPRDQSMNDNFSSPDAGSKKSPLVYF